VPPERHIRKTCSEPAGFFAGANIVKNMIVASSLTNNAGDFTFANIPVGAYSLYPEVMNYATTQPHRAGCGPPKISRSQDLGQAGFEYQHIEPGRLFRTAYRRGDKPADEIGSSIAWPCLHSAQGLKLPGNKIPTSIILQGFF
jgi:hypothetical protein